MKRLRFLAAVLCIAALFCGSALSAYAVEPEDDLPISSPAPDGAGTTGGLDWEGLNPANPLTPNGTGTVVDNATDGDGKEFFTITTEDEAVFYLVIDRQKSGDNVYFLNAVTLADLTALAESKGKPLETPTPTEPSNPPSTTQEPGDVQKPDTPQAVTPVNLGMLAVALAVLAVGGGAGWYLKIYRPKHEKTAVLEDFPEDMDEGEDFPLGPGWAGDEDGDGEE